MRQCRAPRATSTPREVPCVALDSLRSDRLAPPASARLGPTSSGTGRADCDEPAARRRLPRRAALRALSPGRRACRYLHPTREPTGTPLLKTHTRPQGHVSLVFIIVRSSSPLWRVQWSPPTQFTTRHDRPRFTWRSPNYAEIGVTLIESTKQTGLQIVCKPIPTLRSPRSTILRRHVRSLPMSNARR